MPLTIKITEDAIPAEAEGELIADLSAAFLKHNGTLNNKFLPENFPAVMLSIPRSRTYVNGRPIELALVELRVAPSALSSREAKQNWVSEATQLVHRASQGRIAQEHVWVNVVFNEDFWGVAGKTYSNDELSAIIEAADPTRVA
jgi:phenylpyruvate tautomerase PptA (4-oxalocrotonate tautomerase family)